MAQVEGLNLRGSRWYVRILVPGDLQEALGTSRVNLSLDTSERPQAVLRATQKRAEWLSKFEAKRRELNPLPLQAVTPEMSAQLAQRVYMAVLREDDRLRNDLPLLAEMAHVRRELDLRKANPAHTLNLTPPPRDPDDLRGLREDEARELAGLNEYLDSKAAESLSRRNLVTVLPIVQAEAVSLGLSFNPATPGAREALQESLKAYRKALHEVTLRDAGEVVETPSVPSTATPTSNEKRTLRDVYDRWKMSGDSVRTKDTVAACNRALKLFESFAPGVSLKAITRSQGDNFRSWLRENSNTTKTARDRLNWVKSLLKFAAETLEWIPRQPWVGLKIDSVTTGERRPWTDPELKTLFHAPLHQAYELPTAWNSGGAAAYWIPLLGLYGGARLGELCQLRTEDVGDVEGIPVLSLTDEGEGQKIKTKAGRRKIPIHSELIRLGFLDYVATVRASGSVSLWPTLRLREGKPSGYFSNWFSGYRRGIGLGEKPDFHCFRHTVRPLMRRAGFSESTMDKITGHESGGSVGTIIYDHWTVKEVQAAVEAISYPALKLLKTIR
ncbi:MAG: tyrosine-type recombinase/integrase [Polaromonas sp.]|uniref:site-specific integrase n=1 Tax=Polaromonas sp. TaxID=1869339 RepID=UPI0025D43C8D|nr:site-specific integrase [Polaromonas sp.]MBI2724929.1 tyrosine-type recombinase/integrase [Polaromonas sp.]